MKSALTYEFHTSGPPGLAETGMIGDELNFVAARVLVSRFVIYTSEILHQEIR